MFFTTLLLSYFCLRFTIKNALYNIQVMKLVNTLLKKIMYKEETFENSVIFLWICTRKEIYIKSSREMLSVIIIAGMPGYRRSSWPKNIGKCITKVIKIFHQKCGGLFRNVANFASRERKIQL